MTNFTFYTPTKVVFGRDAENEVGALVQEQNAKKVMIVSGGQSAKASGLLDRVAASLDAAGIAHVSLEGVAPNPKLSLVREGIRRCREEGVDFLLAVGGGSAIDTAKAIGYGVVCEADVWDLFEKKAQPTGCLALGTVLTIAAAGSEMSNSAVISNAEEGTKKALNNDMARPRFAVMNPELTLTLPPYQTAVGCADIIMHTLERYFTPEKPMYVTLQMAEGVLRAARHAGFILAREPQNYDARADLMWAGALSHNGLTGAGGGHGDWASHQLAHELSAKYDLAHGAALTAVWGSWARYVLDANPKRFARLAAKVLDIEPAEYDERELGLLGIEEMEEFFWALELPTSLAEAGIRPGDEELAELATRCTYYGARTIGALQVLGREDILKIYENAR